MWQMCHGKCNAFVNMMCPVNLTTGHMLVKMDFQDIIIVYNLTYWHALGNKVVDILLHTVNKGISQCDVRNLIFKQIGCFHQYMTQMDISQANHGHYLSQYMCSNIKLYNACFETFINSSCPYEASQFQGIGSFLRGQCDIFKAAITNVSCPLFGVHSLMMVGDGTWFRPIMRLIQQYITVIKYKQMNLVPLGWRDVILFNADVYITYYKSILIEGEKLTSAGNYQNGVISTVCDQEAADLYNDVATLVNGRTVLSGHSPCHQRISVYQISCPILKDKITLFLRLENIWIP